MTQESHGFCRVECQLAVHMYQGMEYEPYFAAVEEILKRHGGRPHWGKLHTMGPRELATRYPKWADFLRVRVELDPHGGFLNDYLCTLFGLR
ncbi:D-arabinono-1,4-lactone oxidase [Laceyella sediminis]|uniref:D-arabinono-1,4-lactone oxidase n=2 Tax=Laceyella sediminis TaxID=573074 RepID=A0ABX5EN93_9BACL|nr:D-arabinono-1,4-lactone oxidase [Laceyella sediminis]